MPTNLGIVISKTAQMTAKCTDMCSWNAVPSTLAYAVYRVEEQEETLRVVKQIPLVPGPVAGHSWIKARCILTGGSISLYIYLHIFHCVGVYIYIYIYRERGFRSLPLRNPTWHASVKKASVGTHTRRVFLIYTYSRGILSWPWRNGWQQGC